MRLRAVLFDLDGTLVDSREGICDAFLHALAAEGLPPVDRRAIEATIGAPLDVAFASLTKRPELTERLRAHYRARYDEVCVSGSRLMPGAADVLRALARRAPLAIVTTKRGKYPRVMLAAHGVGDAFATFVGADDVTRLKPDPEPVLVACERLGVAPSEAVMVGDTEWDVLAGKRAGARAVGVLGGHGSPQSLVEAGADAVVTDLRKLPDVLSTL